MRSDSRTDSRLHRVTRQRIQNQTMKSKRTRTPVAMLSIMNTLNKFLARGMALSLAGMAASCIPSGIHIPYQVNLQELDHLSPSKGLKTLDSRQTHGKVIVKRGTNVAVNMQQPGGITEWIQYKDPHLGIPTNANRWVTVDLQLFAHPDDARKYMKFDVEHSWYWAANGKPSTGTLSNGIDYWAPPIRHDPGGADGLWIPLDAYYAYLLVRSGSLLASVKVSEYHTHHHPRGVTPAEVQFVSRLLRQ